MMLMEPDVALDVRSVSKIYSRKRSAMQRRLSSTLRHVVLGKPYDPRAEQLRSDEFYAVKDVNFSLRRGEAIGIIGLNGSGKTTLLRMLAGQILPDGGQITVTGRTASMIDLTAGFQTAASGRDNVFLRGAALGRSREQMLRDFDGIVEFSELSDAIDAPVASYSSGMVMRLAFSILAASAPDVLFIDEVLAVGDFRFRQKCLARVREMREHCAFVMVSHSMRDIMRFCDRSIVLDKGKVAFFGPSPDAVHFFETEIETETKTASERSFARVSGPVFENSDAVTDVKSYWCDAEDNPIKEIVQGRELFFRISFQCNIKTKNLIVGIPMWYQDGTFITGFSTDQIFKNIHIRRGGLVDLRLRVPNFYFNSGEYYSTFVIVDGAEFLWRKPIEPLRVTPRPEPYWGIVSIPYEWEQPHATAPKSHSTQKSLEIGE